MKKFLDEIKEQTTSVLAIDFDKVIHKCSKGFHDGTIYDEPVEGTENALKYLSLKYTLVIFTCKARPDRPQIDGKAGKALIWEWLHKYDLAKYISSITHEKPRAKAYIDDKAIRFYDWLSVMEEL